MGKNKKPVTYCTSILEDLIERNYIDTKRKPLEGYGSPTSGMYEMLIETHKEHIKAVDEGDWRTANKTLRSFCLVGCFAIELSIKTYLINLNLKDIGIRGELANRHKVGHDIGALIQVLKRKSPDIYDRLEKFIDKNKLLLDRTSIWGIDQLICGKLLDFGDMENRYNKSLEQDLSVVLLFIVFLKKAGMMDTPPVSNKRPELKSSREYINLEEIDYSAFYEE